MPCAAINTAINPLTALLQVPNGELLAHPIVRKMMASLARATAEVAKVLEIQRGDVLLHLYAQLFDGSGKVVDYSLSYFIPGYFHFHVVRRVGTV